MKKILSLGVAAAVLSVTAVAASAAIAPTIINEAVEGMSQISEVVQVNSSISFNAQDTAQRLDEEAGKLIEMVNSN